MDNATSVHKTIKMTLINELWIDFGLELKSDRLLVFDLIRSDQYRPKRQIFKRYFSFKMTLVKCYCGPKRSPNLAPEISPNLRWYICHIM